MTSSSEIERAAAAWLARRDADDWSDRDQAQLDAWIDAATAHRVAFIRLDAAWLQGDRLKVFGAGQSARGTPARRSWATPRFPARDEHVTGADRLRPSPRKLRRRSTAEPLSGPACASRRPVSAKSRTRRIRYLAIPLVLLLTVGMVLGWRYYDVVDQGSFQTAVGELRQVPLADGSTVTLSSNSRIAFTLSRGERDVDLQRGEAFFVVAKDPGRPFVVNADGRRAIAVGTRFAVRREDGAVRVVVTEGVVRLEPARDPGGPRQPTTVLPAGSIALARATGVVVRSESVPQAKEYLSWREGFLSFHDTPLASAVAEFNRYNTRKIVIGDSAIGVMHVGGNFRWDNTEAFVRLLEQGFPIRAERRQDTVVLYHL